MDKLKETIDNLSLTNDETKRLTEAFKKDEFKKLFLEYAQELQDPENRKLYEAELTAMENERGMDVEFINPSPGHVLKTIQNGNKKIFLNVCYNDKVEKATSSVKKQNKSLGTNWSIPHSFSPPREDIDKKKDDCLVYDVVFHPETYELGQKNPQFRQMLHQTALEGLEKMFQITVDKINYKILKMKMKGPPTATVIRRKREDFHVKQEQLKKQEDDPVNFPYPYPIQETKTSQYNVTQNNNVEKETSPNSEYTQPDFKIKYSNRFDVLNYTGTAECRYQSRPDTIVVEIKLPLLNSSNALDIDINRNHLKLNSERPVKYLLELKLTYPVLPDNSVAKFDKSKRLLILTLPVEPVPLSQKAQESEYLEKLELAASGDTPSLIEEQENLPQEPSIEQSISPPLPQEVLIKQMPDESHDSNETIQRVQPDIHAKYRETSQHHFILIDIKNVNRSTCQINQLTNQSFDSIVVQLQLVFDNQGQGGWINYYCVPLQICVEIAESSLCNTTAIFAKNYLDRWCKHRVQFHVNTDNLVVRLDKTIDLPNDLSPSWYVKSVLVQSKLTLQTTILTSSIDEAENKQQTTVSLSNQETDTNFTTSNIHYQQQHDILDNQDQQQQLQHNLDNQEQQQQLQSELSDAHTNPYKELQPMEISSQLIESQQHIIISICPIISNIEECPSLDVNDERIEVLDINNQLVENSVSFDKSASEQTQLQEQNFNIEETIVEEHDSPSSVSKSASKPLDLSASGGIIPSEFFENKSDPTHRTKTIDFNSDLIFDLE